MGEHLELSPRAVEQIAQRVVVLLKQKSIEAETRRYVDASAIADELGVERDWVYAHAEELGVIRLGGPKGRLRFDRLGIREQLKLRQGAAKPDARTRRKGQPGSRSKPRLGSSQTQRRASGSTPARSPKRHQPGGNPDDEA